MRRLAFLISLLLLGPGVRPVAGTVGDAASADSTLHARIASAAPGDTVLVRGGVWDGLTLVIDKPLTLLGVDDPVLDGRGTNELMHITADSVVVSGFTFRNVDKTFMSDRSALRVEGAGACRITENRFEDVFFGVYLAEARDCVIENNTFRGNATREVDGGNGIHSWYSKRLDIRGNIIRGHRDGIYLEFTEDSNVAQNDVIESRRYGLHFMFSDRCTYEDNRFLRNQAGVAVMYADNVVMKRNLFMDAWGPSAYGLLLKEIKDGTVENNRFEGNSVALLVESTDRISFSGNAFRGNGWGIKLMASAVNNRLDGNVFVRNTFDVATNSRSASSTFDGNYWDRYAGYDLDRDGTGDVPFHPVTLFSLVVESNEAALFLMRSVLVDVLNAAERLFPVLTPEALRDDRPLMNPPVLANVPKAPNTDAPTDTPSP